MRQLRKDNKGAAIVMVIVTVAMISILVSVLMMTSLLNYQMKKIEASSKDNFYNAEAVLDEIKAGLLVQVSDAIESAYQGSMENFTSTSEVDRTDTFRTTYINYLVSHLKGVSNDVYNLGAYDATKVDATGVLTDSGLLSYLDKNLVAAYASNRLKISSTKSCSMEALSTGLVLYGIKIEYEDENGYFSEINTDIRVAFPNMNLSRSTVLPTIFDYSLIAESAISASATGNLSVKGNVYAGNGGISFSGDAPCTFSSADRVVTRGDINLQNVTSGSVTFNNVDIWAQNLRVESSKLNANGNFYIRDDLSLQKKNCGVVLSGKYYGYGVASEADGSSAMIMNGSESTLNLTGLSDLLLAGNAYIGTQAVTYKVEGADTNNTNDVLLGNSLAMKSDQIAFLVPSECIGVSRDGVVQIGRNPMTKTQYQQWCDLADNTKTSYLEGYQMVNFSKTTTLLGKSLNTYYPQSPAYTTVFKTIGGDTLCYVYLNFSEAGAAAYLQDYYAAADAREKNYIQKYNNTIQMRSSYRRLSTNGNTVSCSIDGAGQATFTVNNRNLDASNDSALQTERAKYQDSYDALCSKLTLNKNDLTTDELSKGVYTNLINTAVVNALTETKTYPLAAYNISAVVVDNVGDIPFSYNYSSSNPIELIIASGDVVINGQFKGTVLAGGTITLASGATISSDKENVIRLLQSSTDVSNPDAPNIIETYFNNGAKYVLSSTSGAVSTENYINLADLLVYENWSKQ